MRARSVRFSSLQNKSYLHNVLSQQVHPAQIPSLSALRPRTLAEGIGILKHAENRHFGGDRKLTGCNYQPNISAEQLALPISLHSRL